MTALVVIVGFIVGFAYWRFPGGLQGALFGYLVASVLNLRQRLRELENPSVQAQEEKLLEPEPVPGEVLRKGPAEPKPVREEVIRKAPAEEPLVLPETAGAERDLFERFWDWLKPYVTGPSLIVTVGVVVLFFGVAFLLKYAVERDLFPIELRLASAALGGIALLVLGFRTRRDRPGFGLALQGGGVGILYLTVFAAFRLYELVPGAMAFALLVSFVVLSVALAIAQSSLALATLATVGGFLAPVLTSTGEGSHVALFSYYALLNAGILATAWFRRYRLLNLLGFLFTFVISSSWGLRYYRPEYFSTTEPFLAIFFVLYVAIAVVFALRHSTSRSAFVDGTLVFGVPLVSAVLQSALVRDFEYGMAWSALALGAFYIALAVTLLRRWPEAARDLGESFLSLGIVFSTLAVPFAFENLVTSAFWALEGAAMVWVGVRQRRFLPRLFGAALSILAGLLFLLDFVPAGTEPVWNARFLGGVLIALAGLTIARNLHARRDLLKEWEKPFAEVFFGWGLVWWVGNGLHEAAHFASTPDAEIGFSLIFLAVTAGLSILIGRRLAWLLLEKVSLGLLPSMSIVALVAADALEHPFQGVAAPGWLAAFGAHVLLSRMRAFETLWHAAGLWLFCVLTAWESSYVVGRLVEGAAWGRVMWGVVPLATLLVVSVPRRMPSVYLTWGAAPVAAYLLLWIAASSFSSTWDPSPLPYLPVLSPIDLTVLLGLATLWMWHSRSAAFLEERGLPGSVFRVAVASAAFYWMHGVIFRSVHFGLEVPFDAEAMFDSVVVQTAVAVLWAATGLGCMVAGTRRSYRSLWAAGAVLMGAVVVKLFLVDLSHTGTIARIVSFLGVGVLLLVVGYLSPVPPRERSAT